MSSQKLNRLRQIIMQTIVGADTAFCDEYAAHHLRSLHKVTPIDLLAQSAIQYVRPTVPSRKTVTACAIEFMKTVGADLYIRPNAPFGTTASACATQFVATKIGTLFCLYGS